MLAKLGIRQRLALLLAIPVAAVVVVMAGFVVERATDASAAAATARTAMAAREIGTLIQTLQQERLLALGYLSASNLDRGAVVAKTQDAIDDTARLRDDPVTAPVIEKAAHELGELSVVRQGVVARSTLPLTVYTAYRNANTALLDALNLISAPGADAQGRGQLAALEALMRSNEEASSVGAVLVAAAADPTLSRSLLNDAMTAEDQYLARFRQLVPAQQVALLDAVENGQAGQRIRQVILIVTGSATPAPAEVSEALTAAITYAGLRRLAQDRVARDIADAAQRRSDTARTIVYGVAGGAVAVLIVVVWLGITVGRSISRPLRRLTRAAAAVAELSRAELVRVADSDTLDPQPPQLAAIEVDSGDEIGELATALNRVQTTAALLLQRQVTTRANIGVMFANIARRTQNLVGRQLTLIDDLERVERSPELLQRIQRLDHVATRLRRSADSLLVVSGTIEQEMSGNPSHLSEVIGSALAEIEGFETVEVGPVPAIAVSASLVGDLRLLLAELLENATNFSPPGSPVEVSAVVGEECQIVIVDHGVGMGPARLREENQRLVERERLDVAPTTVLGLFVVGRLARRHGMTVHLDHSPGRGITATVRVPVRLLTTVAKVIAIPAQRRPRPALVAAGQPSRALAAVSQLATEVAAIGSTEPFEWFATDDAPSATAPTPAAVTSPTPAAVPVPVRATAQVRPATLSVDARTGLARRVPGTHMVEKVLRGPLAPAARPTRDPEAERDVLNDYLSGVNRGSGEPGPNQAERHQ